MDAKIIELLVEVVSNNLFPIVCCFYMININNKTVKENTAVTIELKDLIKQLVNKNA